MSVRPFCINIEDMSFDQVKEIFSKAIAAGGKYIEGVESMSVYSYFGIDYELETYFWNKVGCYSSDDINVPLITIDQLDEYLGLTTEENKVENTITDLRNTAIKLDVMRKEDIEAYVSAAKLQGSGVSHYVNNGGWADTEYIECVDVGAGYKLYFSDQLEPTTQIINFVTTWKAIPVEREKVVLFGEEYYVDELKTLLGGSTIAKVGGVITPSAGGGVPPDKKIV
jgi:hypothetical protein